MTLESAIPEHLQSERIVPSNTPGHDFNSPFPAYVARFPQSAKDLVMAIIGAQYAPESHDDGAAAMDKLSEFMRVEANPSSSSTTPSFWELASVTDKRGYYNVAILAYWQSESLYLDWATKSGFDEWWNAIDPEEYQHGWFLEVFFPTLDRFETVFTNTSMSEGAANMREDMSGPIREHGYWGSMRDRFPAGQYDELPGEPARMHHHRAGTTNGTTRSKPPNTGRVRVPGKENLCIIRSGQDWSDTRSEERKLYLDTMHPVLKKGMTFLRDHGDEVGCYSCRFMDNLDAATKRADRDRSFGLAYFDDVGSLEWWSRRHRTHLDIFNGFIQYTRKLDDRTTLRLFHEVFVVKPEQQLLEYVGCHGDTGMLVSLGCEG